MLMTFWIKKGSIDSLSNDEAIGFSIPEKNLDLPADTKLAYSNSATFQKREFVNVIVQQ